MDLKVIEEIKESCTIRRINSYCNKILKKLSFKSSTDIGNLTDLVALLYVFDMYDEAVRAADILDELEFTGNFTIWDLAFSARMIEVKILTEQGNIEKAKKIMSIAFPPEDSVPKCAHVSVKYMLDLYDKNIEIEKNNGLKSGIQDWKLDKLEIMFYYLEKLDGTVDKKQLEQDILELKEELKTLVK